ncbi:MAG: hypothetical protein M5R40_17680 [Anaerolineae bacterium]|nr:hypothetical protein [Anaerolineae bacterium]
MRRRLTRWVRMMAVFTPVIVFIVACPVTLFPTWWPAVLNAGFLEVDIDYNDDFYVETFGYSRQAENIRHFVLVMPEKETSRVRPNEVFSRLRFPTNPGDPLLEDGSEEIAWALDYLYHAPEGHFVGAFEPGNYGVAVVFIAASVSREEGGHGEDAILWPGITGGGASTDDYQQVIIERGKTVSLDYLLTDADGWACPWLYVYNGHAFERRTEILRDVRGRQSERTEISPLGPVSVVGDSIVLRVSEEREEISFIDELYVLVGGVRVRAEGAPDVAAKVAERDGDYLVIASGESVEFRFRVPEPFAGGEQVDAVSVVVSGFYTPLE